MFIIDDLEYDNKDIIIFKDGIPGFEKYTKYILVDVNEFKPFKVLYCIGNKDFELKFILLNSDLIENYKIKASKNDKKEVGFKENDALEFFNIVTLNNTELNDSTINLMGPILINQTKKIGKQLFLDENKFNPKHYFLKKGV